MSCGETISVVVTCFNLEDYIEQAVRSALAQEDAGEFEIIVVDDCSTDNSLKILSGLPGIRVIELDRNSGVMLATIAGTRAATGDIVCYLDGDDLWEPGKLAAVRKAYADPSVALVTHDLAYIDDKGGPLNRPTRVAQEFGKVGPGEWPALTRKGIVSLGDYVWLGSALAIRKSAAQWDGFAAWVESLEDPRNIYQDWPLAFWIASIPDAGLAYIPEKLFRYRLHGANHSGDARTPERAARNYQRTFLTMSAIGGLAADRPVCAPFMGRIRSRIALNEAAMLAYRGNRIAAAGKWFKAAPGQLTRKFEAVALAKLAAVIALGPKLVTRLRR